MSIPFKAAAVTTAATAVMALSTATASAGPTSTISYGHEIGENLSTNCAVVLYYNSHTKWAYVNVFPFRRNWSCKGFVKNTYGSKSWTAKTSDDAWSGGVWRGKGYKVQACTYVYYKNRYQGWSCTNWH